MKRVIVSYIASFAVVSVPATDSRIEDTNCLLQTFSQVYHSSRTEAPGAARDAEASHNDERLASGREFVGDVDNAVAGTWQHALPLAGIAESENSFKGVDALHATPPSQVSSSSLLSIAAQEVNLRSSGFELKKVIITCSSIAVLVLACLVGVALCMDQDKDSDSFDTKLVTPRSGNTTPPRFREAPSRSGSLGSGQLGQFRSGEGHNQVKGAAQEPQTAAPIQARPVEPLCSSLVVPHGLAAYVLPDLTHAQRQVEVFDIFSQTGTPVLGLVFNDGGLDDPGILLHAARASQGPSRLLAFINTSPELRRKGRLPILRPSLEQEQGEFFGTLEFAGLGGPYEVVVGSSGHGRSVMRIEGDFRGRNMQIYGIPAGGDTMVPLGSTSPCGEMFGQIGFEAQISAGGDVGLSIICLLAISRLTQTGPVMPTSTASTL